MITLNSELVQFEEFPNKEKYLDIRELKILPDKFNSLMRILTQSENQKQDELLKDVLDLLCGITKCPSPCDMCPLYSIKNLTDFLQNK